MKKVAEVQTMCAQHDQLRDVANLYRQQLAQPGPDPRALADCRWKLMRLVTGHLAYEGVHLYPTLTQAGGRHAVLAREMALEIEQLSCELQCHVRDWTSERIANEWLAYRQVATALIETLERRLDREEQDLYPLLVMAKAA